jgi:hypothetical protein
MKFYTCNYSRIDEEKFRKFIENAQSKNLNIETNQDVYADSFDRTYYVMNNEVIVAYSVFSFADGKEVYYFHNDYVKELINE